MLRTIVLFAFFSFVVCKDCYWNAQCPYMLHSTKTPYDTVRGDIRDEPMPDCQPVSVWSLHRHGNRNPGSDVTSQINQLQKLILDQIRIEHSNNGTKANNCLQDIEDLLSWSWNSTMDTSSSYLTGVGYEELYDIGTRIKSRFPTLLSATPDNFYFRPTHEQRTIVSCVAFVHGLTDGTGYNLTTSIDESRPADSVIRPYESCDQYQNEVKNGKAVVDALEAYDTSPEVIAVRNRVQARLGITYQLTVADTYNIYELCRFYRSWSPKLQCPWCSFLTNEDLEVLEYRDDVRHYYRNGYGSQVNVNLGVPVLRDLFENFQNATANQGKNIVSYFSHDTMFEMVLCALGLYKDAEPLPGSRINPNRLWRTSEMAAFSVNLIAVLFQCQDGYRVQILINEKPTPICPAEGCTWQQFVERFQVYSNPSIDTCSDNNYNFQGHLTAVNGSVMISIMSILMLLPALLVCR